MITSKQTGAVTTIVHDYSGDDNSETLSNSGKVVFQTTHHIRTPGYKQEYGDGTQGWAVEKGFGPKPIGGAFVQYEVHRHGLSKGKPTNIYADIRVTPHIHSPEYFDI